MGKLTSTYAMELLRAIRNAGFEKFSEDAAAALALRALGVASRSSVRRYVAYLVAVGEAKPDHPAGVWRVCRPRE